VSFSWSGRRLIMGQFLSFSVVGALGFLVDVTVLSLALIGGLGLYTGRVVSYPAAATFTWWCNSKVTFRSTNVGLKLEWFRFVLWNTVGGPLTTVSTRCLLRRMVCSCVSPHSRSRSDL
jgi:putative flippase GtrA